VANEIKLKRSSTASAVPVVGDLALGELAINTYDGKLYLKKNDGSDSIVEIGGGGAGEWTVSGTDLLQSTAGIIDLYMSDAVTDATPLAQTIHGQGGSGTDIDGASLTIVGGQGTGTGVGGEIIFKTADAGLTGSSLNTLSERMMISQDGWVSIGSRTSFSNYTAITDIFQVGGSLVTSTTKEGVTNAWEDRMMNAYYDVGTSTYKRINTDYASYYYQGYGGHFWYTAATGDAGTNITWSEQIRFLASQEVRIQHGTTNNTTAQLQVQSQLYGFAVNTDTSFEYYSNGVHRFKSQVEIKETSNPITFTAGYGQIWVKSDTPSSLHYQDDAGTDYTVALLDSVGEHLILPSNSNAPTPTLSFGDGDTGLYEASANIIGMAMSGSLVWVFSAASIYDGSNVTGPKIAAEVSSSTNPTLIPNRFSSTAGIGGASGTVSIITSGTEAIHIDSSQKIGINVTPKTWHSSREALQIGNAAAFASSNVSASMFIGNNFYKNSSNLDKRIITGYSSTIDFQSNGIIEFSVGGTGNADDTITWVKTTLNSVGNWEFNGKLEMGDTAGPVLVNEAATATNPTLISNKADLTTGVGGVSGIVSLITGSTERVRIGASGGIFIAEISGAEADVAGYGQLWVKDDSDNTLWFTNDGGDDIRLGGIQLQTDIATTSGTSHEYTSIPAWVKKITIMFSGVSTNGTSIVLIQMGDSGGYETSGYLGSASYATTAVGAANHSSGFQLATGAAAGDLIHGLLTLALLDASSNTWVISGTLGRSDITATYTLAGSKALSAALDRVRLTTAGGTDTFDAGTFNISWE